MDPCCEKIWLHLAHRCLWVFSCLLDSVWLCDTLKLFMEFEP